MEFVSIRERLLRESESTLQKTVDICLASEVSRKQVKSLSDQSSANVDALGKDQRKHNYRGNFRNHNNKPETENPQTNPAAIVVEFTS